MAYIKEPPKDLWLDRTFLSLVYFFMGAGSLALCLLTPNSPGAVIPVAILDVAGIIATIGCAVAVYGVFKFSVLIEMTAVWIGSAALVAYIVSNFFLTLQTPTRLAFLLFLFQGFAFVVWRSWRLRRQAAREGRANE